MGEVLPEIRESRTRNSEEDVELMEVDPIPSQPNAAPEISGGKAPRIRTSKHHRYRPAAASRRQIRAYQKGPRRSSG